jgi:HK97 family phage portal protein
MGLLRRVLDSISIDTRNTAFTSTYPNVYVDAAGRMTTHFADVNAGVWVDTSTALSVPGIWRGVTLIADAIGALPLHAYRSEEYVDPQPSILERPVATETRIETISAMVAALLIHGNYVAILGPPGSNGYPESFFPVDPAKVGVRRENGSIVYRVNNVDYDSSEILHIKGFSLPGELVGYGILAAQRQAIGGAIATQTYSQRYFNGGAVPPVYLESDNPDLTQDEASALKAAWLQSYGGINMSPPVFNASTRPKTLAITPRDSQLLEARQYSLTEIANMIGLPAYYLGAPNSSRTYSNVSEENLQLVRWSLMPWISRIEQKMTDYIPRGQVAKFNVDALLRPDTKTRYEAHAIALDKGFLTINEVRELENREPLDETISEEPKPAEIVNDPSQEMEEPEDMEDYEDDTLESEDNDV